MSGLVRPLEPDEAPAAALRAAVSFGRPVDEENVERWRERIDAGEVWGVVDDDGRVRAHCRITVVDHWFGGRRVPAQHVASVAVGPEDRGQGFARTLMVGVMRRDAARGIGLSLLFPATTRLYRRLDYEHAGTFLWYALDARHAPQVGPPMRPAREQDWPAIRECALRASSRQQGPAVRPDEAWERLRETTYSYVLDASDGAGLDAYALFDHATAPGDWQYTLEFTDWAATTARGLEAVVGLVGRHGSMGKGVRFRGPVPDAFTMLTDEQDVRLDGGFFWMARGLDLPAAVVARGFPPGLSGSVTLSVDDPLLPDAAGPWRLEVADGQGTLSPAGHADVRLSARGFGPLFTGFRSPSDLALGGVLDGPADALAWLAGAFAGPAPTLIDFF